jgi:hypothetical protein
LAQERHNAVGVELVDSTVAVRVSGQHGQVTAQRRGVVEQHPHNDRGWSFDDVVDRFTIEVQAGRSGVVDVNDGPAGRMWQCAHWLFPGEGVG